MFGDSFGVLFIAEHTAIILRAYGEFSANLWRIFGDLRRTYGVHSANMLRYPANTLLSSDILPPLSLISTPHLGQISFSVSYGILLNTYTLNYSCLDTDDVHIGEWISDQFEIDMKDRTWRDWPAL